VFLTETRVVADVISEEEDKHDSAPLASNKVFD